MREWEKKSTLVLFSVLRPIWKAFLRSHIFILIIYPGLYIFYLLKIYVPREAIEWRQYENRNNLSDSKLRMLYDIKYRDDTFFSSAHRIFSRIDHILGHKSSLSRFKKTEIVSSIFFDHNAMGLEINYRKKTVKKKKKQNPQMHRN